MLRKLGLTRSRKLIYIVWGERPRYYLVIIYCSYCSGAGIGMTEQLLDDYIQSVTPAIPLGRTGTADEIAKAIAFLAFGQSSLHHWQLTLRTAVRARSREWPVTWNWNASHRMSFLRRRICRIK
jgi:hypothetical protein